jgi:adenosine deaminase
MDAGIPVCINTDNPIISRTDIVKEYFMASKAIGGLSLWDALRLVKTGFRHAFLSLPIRKAMIEVVDQILFDLFSDPRVQADLRELVEVKATGSRT